MDPKGSCTHGKTQSKTIGRRGKQRKKRTLIDVIFLLTTSSPRGGLLVLVAADFAGEAFELVHCCFLVDGELIRAVDLAALVDGLWIVRKMYKGMM